MFVEKPVSISSIQTRRYLYHGMWVEVCVLFVFKVRDYISSVLPRKNLVAHLFSFFLQTALGDFLGENEK